MNLSSNSVTPFGSPAPKRLDASAEGGLGDFLQAMVVALVLMIPIVGFGGREVFRTWREKEDAREAAAKLARAHSDLVSAPALAVVSVNDAAHGRDLFVSTCITCHGADARGVSGLGKDLTTSNFVASLSDDELRQFILEGRPNARPVAMPPKAGRDDLTEDDLRHIVAYLRGLQDPRRMPALPELVVSAAPTAAQKEAAMAAAGGDAELAEYIASGDKLFHSSCVVCHGRAGVGVSGNGKALVNNEFIRSLDDEGLLTFIKQGRSPSDPKNTTGIQMPPKGGNPAMSDDDILDVIAYLRTLNGNKPGAAAAR